MKCAICHNSLTEEPEDLLGGLFSGSREEGPSTSKRRRSSATGGCDFGGNGSSSSSGGGGGQGSAEEETGLRVTNCGHPFHTACILRWLEVKTKEKVKKCPLCQNSIQKKTLRPLYLDGEGQGIEKKLREEVEEKSKQLVQAKRGQREMSRRIDELFEENEKLKKKNKELEGLTKTSDYVVREVAKNNGELKEKNRELVEENRKLEEKNRELVKCLDFDNIGELKKKNQTLKRDLEAAKRKCGEAEKKYENLRGKVQRTMQLSGILNKELQAFEQEINGGGKR